MIDLTNFLINLVKKHQTEADIRDRYVSLSGITGIICNILLSAVKFTVGALTGSISVTADAVNNLTDSASNIISVRGAKLSGKPGDKEHPFGHGRIEYVTALIISVSIFIVGFELAKSSIGKIITPDVINVRPWLLLILCITVVVKLWMAYFNHKLYQLTDNLNLKAVRQDSLNDCIATAASVISLIISYTTHLKRIDGIIGIGVSAFILYSGFSILKQVISPLLGEAPSKDLAENIERIITESNIVIGVHDLIIHNYGVNTIIASADAEVDAAADIFTIHDEIDSAERRIKDELNVTICIHMDPIDKNDPESARYKRTIEKILKDYKGLSFHDMMITKTDSITHVSFDLLIPYDQNDEEAILSTIKKRFNQKYPDVVLDIKPEHSLI